MSQYQPPENNLELESQFILRLPTEQASTLREVINSGASLNNRLSIQLNNDMRHGSVKFDEYVMPARLYDLPTIVESYKTLDRKNLYKTADISQILICKDEQATETNITLEVANANKNNKKEFSFPHGITPPLKNVRRKRFRKTMKKKFVDTTEIEKEVRRLFQFDCKAIDVRYEVIEENRAAEDSQQPTCSYNFNASSPNSVMPSGVQSTENSQSFDLVHDLLGELSCSSESDDEDDDDDKEDDKEDYADTQCDVDNVNDVDLDSDKSLDGNIEDDEDDELEAQAEMLLNDVNDDAAAQEAAVSNIISQNEDNDERMQELRKELAKIRERIQVQESEMSGLDNVALRQRLQSVLDSLYAQEKEIYAQIENLNKNY